VNLFRKAFAHVQNRLLIKQMSDVHVRISNRGRIKTLTDFTRKLHKQDNLAKYNKTRICIGAEYDR
jgi:hypothetical protein